MEDLISKKDLLLETNISYGQLYRWKRKGLISEAWFIRRATFTGQETFFPREAILERIRWIQSAKTDAALDELAQEIKNPAKWVATLPIKAVRLAQGRLASGDRGDMSKIGLLAEMIAEQQGLDEGGVDPLAEFLESVPTEWMDQPAAWVVGWHDQAVWRFLVVERPEAVWWGSSVPPLRVSLSQAKKATDAIWERALQIQKKGRGE